MEISIRPATKEDANLIATAIAMAIGMDGAKEYAGDNLFQAFQEAAEKEDTQYSHRNALVAMADGKEAGAIVGYDGGQLKRLREASLAVIRKYKPGLEILEDETEEGEFYLDSLAVLPEYRGHGIGRTLIEAKMQQAAKDGHRRFGLLVDFENPDAERLYTAIGFKPVGQRPFIGHMMKHMQMSL